MYNNTNKSGDPTLPSNNSRDCMKSTKIKPLIPKKEIGFDEKEVSETDLDAQATSVTEFITIARALYGQDGIDVYSDSEIEKWLISQGGHRGKGLEAIAETLAWRKSFKTDTILSEDFSDLESRAKVFLKGNALDGSCLVWWIGSRHEPPKDQANKDREVRYIVYIMEKARKEGILKDKMSIVFDRTGMKLDKSDLNFAMGILPIFQKHYPEKMSRVYIFPKNTIMSMLFKMFSMALKPATVQRIVLKGGPECLMEGIGSDNILERYGGSLKEGVVVQDAMEKHAKDAHDSGVVPTQEESDEEFMEADEDPSKDLAELELESPTFKNVPPLPNDKTVVIEQVWSAPEDVLD